MEPRAGNEGYVHLFGIGQSGNLYLQYPEQFQYHQLFVLVLFVQRFLFENIQGNAVQSGHQRTATAKRCEQTGGYGVADLQSEHEPTVSVQAGKQFGQDLV